MPVLRNPKHELFAQAVAKGVSGTLAYQQAGYDVADNVACASGARLLAKVNVRSRVEELKERIAERVVARAAMSKLEIIAALEDNATEARASGQHGPANRAYELVGRERGMFVERKEIGAPGDFANLTDEEIEREYRALTGEHGKSVAARRGITAAADQARVRGKPSSVH